MTFCALIFPLIMRFATPNMAEICRFFAGVANSILSAFLASKAAAIGALKNGGNALPHQQKARCGKVWQVWHGHGRNAATPPTPPFRGVGWGKACGASLSGAFFGGANA